MASDRHIIEEQLRHAIATGNKKRVARLKKILKAQDAYDAGKSERSTANRRHRPHTEGFERNVNDFFDKFRRTAQDSDEYYASKEHQKNFSSFDAYHAAKEQQRSWKGSTSMNMGDRKRARKIKFKRKMATAGQKINRVANHPVTVLGSAAAYTAATLGGATYARVWTDREAKLKTREQYGKQSNKNRGRMRRGVAITFAGIGGMTGLRAGLTYDTSLGRMTKSGAVGAVAGGAAGYGLSRLLVPNNNKSKQKWVVYKQGPLGAERSKINNPYYYQQRGNKRVRVKKGKRK